MYLRCLASTAERVNAARENFFHVKPVVPWEIGVGDHFDPSNKSNTSILGYNFLSIFWFMSSIFLGQCCTLNFIVLIVAGR